MKHASNDTQRERIGKRLKQVRQYLLLTQQQVGEATAIPVITISKIEHDKSVNSDSFIQLLLFYSNYISVDFLLATDFNLADADRYAKSFSLNSIVKAKILLIKRGVGQGTRQYQEELSATTLRYRRIIIK